CHVGSSVRSLLLGSRYQTDDPASTIPSGPSSMRNALVTITPPNYPLTCRLTRKGPPKSKKLSFAWPVGCSGWFAAPRRLLVPGVLARIAANAGGGRGVEPPEPLADAPQPRLRVRDGDVDVTPAPVQPSAAADHLAEAQPLQLLFNLVLVVAA